MLLTLLSLLTGLKKNFKAILIAVAIAIVAAGGLFAVASFNSMESKISGLTEQITTAKDDAKDAKTQAVSAGLALENYKKASEMVVNALDNRAEMSEENRRTLESLDALPKSTDRPYINSDNLYYASRVREHQQAVLDSLDAQSRPPNP